MVFPLIQNPSHLRVRELRGALDEFYGTTRDYQAFVEPGDNSAYYQLMSPIIDGLLRNRTKIRILEYGCGRTTFRKFLGPRAEHVHFIAQDVTKQNAEYLAGAADEVVLDEVAAIRDPVDLAFSTFVLEHVSCPEEHLRAVARLIALGGAHVIFCPNYELPGYLCPSLRHLSPVRRLAVAMFLATSRLAARIDRRPRFWVNADPAFRHVDWYRDADAVHIVSRRDLEWWHERAGFSVERLRTPRPRQLRGLATHFVFTAITTMLTCTRIRCEQT
jgi:SAM-dependent methyltransferase